MTYGIFINSLARVDEWLISCLGEYDEYNSESGASQVNSGTGPWSLLSETWKRITLIKCEKGDVYI